MEKKNVIKLIVIIGISIFIVMVISKYLFDNTGIINQGNFRVNDLVVESSLDIVQDQEDNVSELSNMVLDISQNNTLKLLIAKNIQIESANISNIKLTSPVKVGNMSINQTGYELVSDINEDTIINIYPEEKLDQSYIELNVNNNNCITNVSVPSQTNVVKFDGTILNLLNQNIDELKFDLSFDLNIYDSDGVKNTCKFNLKVPDNTLKDNGISFNRMSVSDYIFKVKK